jgi:hypothetical protein
MHEPGQWICWDFGEMRVRPTHYTIRAQQLPEPFVLEGSLDGEHWTDLDRVANQWVRIYDRDTVSDPPECRFIGLIERGIDRHSMSLVAVEFCGTVFGSLSSRVSAIEKRLENADPTRRFPITEGNQLDGIIRYLTKKHDGNVHEKGIVTVTSKSPPQNGESALKNLVDLTSSSAVIAERRADEWICWNFHEMRLWPTHYKIRGSHLSSWVVEGSEDGTSWREIDRQSDNQELNNPSEDKIIASFAVSKPTTSRFIRLTQTTTPKYSFYPTLTAVEFFGTLSA